MGGRASAGGEQAQNHYETARQQELQRQAEALHHEHGVQDLQQEQQRLEMEQVQQWQHNHREISRYMRREFGVLSPKNGHWDDPNAWGHNKENNLDHTCSRRYLCSARAICDCCFHSCRCTVLCMVLFFLVLFIMVMIKHDGDAEKFESEAEFVYSVLVDSVAKYSGSGLSK